MRTALIVIVAVIAAYACACANAVPHDAALAMLARTGTVQPSDAIACE